MTHYRLYALDENGHIRKPFDLECADDASAIAEVKLHETPNGYEIWQGARLVYPAPLIEAGS